MNMDNNSSAVSQNEYGLNDKLLTKISTGDEILVPIHPLEKALKQESLLLPREQMRLMKQKQGLYAPLQLAMECMSATKVQRLPCLSSSNLQIDTFLGRDYDIGFEDFLGEGHDTEALVAPHVTIEKQLRLL